MHTPSITPLSIGVKILDCYGKSMETLSFEEVSALKMLSAVASNKISRRMQKSLENFLKQNYENIKITSALNLSDHKSQCANGFDIEAFEPVLVAEVKQDIPINGKYLNNQVAGLKRDIESLIDGKKKSNVDVSESIKILGLVDTEEIRSATAHMIINRLGIGLKDRVCEWDASCKFVKDIVQIVYLRDI